MYWHRVRKRGLPGTRNYIIPLLESQHGSTPKEIGTLLPHQNFGRSWRKGTASGQASKLQGYGDCSTTKNFQDEARCSRDASISNSPISEFVSSCLGYGISESALLFDTFASGQELIALKFHSVQNFHVKILSQKKKCMSHVCPARFLCECA